MSAWHPSFVEPCRPGPGCVARFAVRQSDQPVRIELPLHVDADGVAQLALAATDRCRLEDIVSLDNGDYRVVLLFDPPADPQRDDEILADLSDAAHLLPPCRVVLRRSVCELHTSLLRPDEWSQEARQRWPRTEAALLWFGWGRFRELVGIKCFSSGRSGKDVLVFRPRLAAPDTGGNARLATSHPNDALADTWGSWLLVKSGEHDDVAQEWDRFQTFLRDRLHPFLARSEELLAVHPAVGQAAGLPLPGRPAACPTAAGLPLPGRPAACPTNAVLVSSFLGGDLLRTETLEDVIREAGDFADCRTVLDRALDLLAPWHAAARDDDLGRWRRVYHPGDPAASEWLLFGKFDLARESSDGRRRGRREYAAGVPWDFDFVKEDHLSHYLLGKPAADGADPAVYDLPGPRRNGLLGDLMSIRVRFGLVHGDLNPRNVLCQGDNAWLIDFEHTGVGPVLADYARLEVNLRLWCLTLAPGGEDVAGAAEQLERCLLDHFHGSAGGLCRVRALAASLGADADELARVVACIAHVRQRAATHGVEDYADRRDYLAVLFLTVLSLVQYAAEEGAAPPANYCHLLALARVLEDVLGGLLGRRSRERRCSPSARRHVLTADWLADAGAPARVAYVLARPDGRAALAPLAACRGVLQNDRHHLDVLDHTLLVLANVEALLADPVGGILDPAGLDACSAAATRELGLPPIPVRSRAAPTTGTMPQDVAGFLREVVADEESRLLLKWLALLHDVGKPGTRGVHQGRVHFIGHEVYGAQLVRGLLEQLFPVARQRQRLSRMIPAHHAYHQIVAHYTDHPDAFAALRSGLEEGQLPREGFAYLDDYVNPTHPKYVPDFVLLMLHGYADRLAGRGQAPGEALVVALAVLTFCARHDALRQHLERHNELFRELEQRLAKHHGEHARWKAVQGRVLGECRTWFKEERQRRQEQGLAEPTGQDLEAHAASILGRECPLERSKDQ